MENKTHKIITGVLFLILVTGVMPVNASNTTNLGISSEGSATKGEITIIAADEAGQGSDLNGDGDATDRVLYVYNSTNSTLTNVGFDINFADFDENHIAFGVREANQGNTDLNGDGDTTDEVIHIYDISTGIITNLAIAKGNADNIFLDGNNVAFKVGESAQNSTDLNSDGDTLDDVLHVYDIMTNSTTNVGLSGANEFILDGNNVALLVDEAGQGNTDLNGDGDTTDEVIHIYDISTGITTNLGLAGSNIFMEGNNLIFLVHELLQGNTDLNSDGDANDNVLHVQNISANSTTNLGLDSNAFELAGNNIAFSVNESGQNFTDFNGDGDSNDNVLHVYDISGNSTTNTLHSTEFSFQIDGNYIAFKVNESHQGNTDLNSDGDTLDNVLHVYDIFSDNITNTGLAADFKVHLDGNNVVLQVPETSQGNTDLNSDGDTADEVLYTYDISNDVATNLQLNSYFPKLAGNNVAFLVDEADQGNVNLNGDVDTTDQVLHVYDIATKTTTNLELASGQPSLTGNTLSFLVPEAGQGNTDLNGDGDATDNVQHIHNLTPITQTGQATGQVEVAQTCGLDIVSGNPINYGAILPGDASTEQTLTLDNTGNTDLTTLFVSGTDWKDGSNVVQMTVDNTRFSNSTGTFVSKTTLSNTDQAITDSFLASSNLDTFWQLQVNLLDSSFSGSLTQVLDLTVSC